MAAQRSCRTDPENDPWAALCSNVSFAAEKIYLCPDLLRPMMESRIISEHDYNELMMESITQSRRKDRLLLEILPTRPPETFLMFCEILRGAGQDELANRLEGTDRQKRNRGVETKSIERLWQDKELLEARLAALERERRADMLITRSLVAEVTSLRENLSATHAGIIYMYIELIIVLHLFFIISPFSQT